MMCETWPWMKLEFWNMFLCMILIEQTLSFTVIVQLLRYCKNVWSYDTFNPLGVNNEKPRKRILKICIVEVNTFSQRLEHMMFEIFDVLTNDFIHRCLNGFLNNVCGGTVYLGILDDGTVNGFSLTQFQASHFIDLLCLAMLFYL